MASSCLILQRGISTSCVNYGKRNFRKFLLLNKRGSRDFKKKQATDPNPEYPIDSKFRTVFQTVVNLCCPSALLK